MLIAMEEPQVLSHEDKDILLNKWRAIRPRAVALGQKKCSRKDIQ